MSLHYATEGHYFITVCVEKDLNFYCDNEIDKKVYVRCTVNIYFL